MEIRIHQIFIIVLAKMDWSKTPSFRFFVAFSIPFGRNDSISTNQKKLYSYVDLLDTVWWWRIFDYYIVLAHQTAACDWVSADGKKVRDSMKHNHISRGGSNKQEKKSNWICIHKPVTHT